MAKNIPQTGAAASETAPQPPQVEAGGVVQPPAITPADSAAAVTPAAEKPRTVYYAHTRIIHAGKVIPVNQELPADFPLDSLKHLVLGKHVGTSKIEATKIERTK